MAVIDNELDVIKNGRYGSDIRMAIHDALKKVNQNGGGSGEKSLIIGNGIVVGSSGGISDGIISVAEVIEDVYTTNGFKYLG